MAPRTAAVEMCGSRSASTSLHSASLCRAAAPSACRGAACPPRSLSGRSSCWRRPCSSGCMRTAGAAEVPARCAGRRRGRRPSRGPPRGAWSGSRRARCRPARWGRCQRTAGARGLTVGRGWAGLGGLRRTASQDWQQSLKTEASLLHSPLSARSLQSSRLSSHWKTSGTSHCRQHGCEHDLQHRFCMSSGFLLHSPCLAHTVH
mmetsp:Transcript_12458/g.41863  ORF Transcript_12458/g.41863 Transcript_12458/m.41863 type:complete len:204 (+) Transcript_12458:280-891(+)